MRAPCAKHSPMTQAWARIRRWSQTPAPRSPLWPEYTYAAFMVAFGASLLNPTDAFTLSANYAVLARFATEIGWGYFFVAYGAAWFGIVASHNLTLRRGAAIAGAFLLLWLSLSVILSNSASTIGFPFGVVACSAAYCAARLVVPWTQRQ